MLTPNPTPPEAEPENLDFVVPPLDSRTRLDAFLAGATSISRSQLKRLIKSGEVCLNGKPCLRASTKVHESDRVRLDLPPPTRSETVAVDIPLNIIFQDEHIAVVNKQAGLVVHPAPGHYDDTMVNALLFHVGDLSGVGGEIRPGIVHRIDRDTSGLLVVAKHDRAHEGLTQLFARHDIERRYVALVAQVRGPGLSSSGVFDTIHARSRRDRRRFTGRTFTGDVADLPKMGKRAVTHYKVEEKFAHKAFRVSCQLETGRTHQIRVHLAEQAGCPVIGDRLYGGGVMERTTLIKRQALHAEMLGFVHPITGTHVRFEAELPDDIKGAQDLLRKGRTWR